MQDTDPTKFSEKLATIFAECNRVLKDDGLFVFTYHHSRPEGWSALMEAIVKSEFSVINAHPVKAEMSVATPKSQAKEPIQLDIILVCKKRNKDYRVLLEPSSAVQLAVRRAKEKLLRLESIGLTLSANDKWITLVSQFISSLGPIHSAELIHSSYFKTLESVDLAIKNNMAHLLTANPNSQESSEHVRHCGGG